MFFFPPSQEGPVLGMHSLKYIHLNLAHRQKRERFVNGPVNTWYSVLWFLSFPSLPKLGRGWNLQGSLFLVFTSCEILGTSQGRGASTAWYSGVDMGLCLAQKPCIGTAHGQNAELWRLEKCTEPYINILQFWPLFVLVGLLFWGPKQAIMNEQRQW